MSSTEIVIRNAKTSDMDALYTIATEVHNKSYKDLIPASKREIYYAYYTDSTERRVKYFDEKYIEFNNPNWLCLVAEINGKVVGFTAAFDKGDYILKQGLFVDPNFQGHGVGSKLFDTHLALVVAGRTIRLYVMENNTSAKSMYERRNFKEVGVGEKPFFGVPLIRMELLT